MVSSSLLTSSLSLSLLFWPLAQAAADPRFCNDGNGELDASLFTFKTVENADHAALSDVFRTAGKNVSVSAVLDSANRALVKKSNSGSSSELWQWNSGDEATTKWYPQGISSSGDALGIGKWNDREAWLVSWYQKTGEKNVRISFVDRATHKYRHVLLVEPTSGDNFTSVPVHAGGINWYGNSLYVADTSDGLRVFDLDNIWKVDGGDGVGKQADGTYTANDYAYVIPQIRTYSWKTAQPDSRFNHSWISLDRSTTPDSLLVGEYSATDVNTPIRLVRYPLDAATRGLQTSSDGVATSTFAACVNILRMQGGFSLNGEYYLGRSNGANTGGDLFTWKVGESAVKKTAFFLPGPEDLSYNPSRKEYYTVNEHPNKRYIAAYGI